MSFEIKKIGLFYRRMKPHFRRIWKNIKGLKSNGVWCNCCDECYTPREDLGHSLTNLVVEFYREGAYILGHLAAVGIISTLLYLIYRYFIGG